MYRRRYGGDSGNGGGGVSSGANGGGYNNAPPRRRFHGHYYRSRTSPSRMIDKQQDDYQSGPPSQHRSEHQHTYSNSNNINNNNTNQRGQQLRHNDADEIKDLCHKLGTELELVRKRIEEIALNIEQLKLKPNVAAPSIGSSAPVSNDVANKRGKKTKPPSKQRGQSKNDQTSTGQPDGATTTTELNNVERDSKSRRSMRRQDGKRAQETTNVAIAARGDDSTTQAADPSSEDKLEGEDGTGDGRVRRVFRRRKQHLNKRRFYNNRRRRNDSSERNSNDTSPQNELNGDEYRSSNGKPKTASSNRRDRISNGRKRSFPELPESEISEIVQVLTRDFFSPELEAVKKTINTKGPVVAQEFASSILDHAMCDVTSPTKLSEIANNLCQLITSEQGGLEFQQGFYGALSTIAGREDDIAIDAPRYMDTLGQILGECVVPMNSNRYKQLLRRFLNRSLTSYGEKSRAKLLASTMRGIARHKDERFAKDIWDAANLKWASYLAEDVDVQQFIESEEVTFTTRAFSPLPRKPKKTPEELEKFADDVTNLVEKRCTTQTLEELVRDLELELDERVDYLGTLVYAIVRGCLTTDSGDYKLDTDVLSIYSGIINGKSQLQLAPLSSNLDSDARKQLPSKKETFDAIALRALTALTKLWHQYNCPQNLMSNILLALHSHGAASYDALKTWLNSDDLKNIPGIGAARLNSKRCIEDLGNSRS